MSYKRLSEVTEQDAKQIIKAGYPSFFNKDNWKLKDETEVLKEPCKSLYSRYKAYEFTFYDNEISIYLDSKDDDYISFDSTNFDIKAECYVEAHNLGYHVTKFDKLNFIKKQP